MYKIAGICSMLVVVVVLGAPQVFETKKFIVGTEYEHSLPMSGGSERYKHRNNWDPFYVTVTATAKSGYVISYLVVTTTTDADGQVEFNVVRGQTGSRSIVFQLVSNQTEFLSYKYMTYGIREEEYKKIANIITLWMRNNNEKLYNSFKITFLMAFSLRYIM